MRKKTTVPVSFLIGTIKSVSYSNLLTPTNIKLAALTRLITGFAITVEVKLHLHSVFFFVPQRALDSLLDVLPSVLAVDESYRARSTHNFFRVNHPDVEEYAKVWSS